jgi:hypothetical protein
MRPIFHLSIPVRDLDAALSFYVTQLGAEIGRREEKWADALLFGAQVTLQHDPASVSDPMPRTRHFGATVAWADWLELSEGLSPSVMVLEPPTYSFVGEAIEQAKVMIADDSGNRIEIKAYRNPQAVLGSLAAE